MSNRSTDERPNVIFVLTDDQGYGDLSYSGNPVLRTPALDRLHAESVRFTDFHVCPVCTPTRGELLTGRDALRNGATFVCMGRSLLRADLPTMADIFADEGYHTGHFGKWHLGDNAPYRPQDRGFQETIWHPSWGITSAADFFGNDYFDDHYRHRDEIEQYRGYCTDIWFDEGIAWMKQNVKNGDPFFAYIATNAPHGPLWVPDHYRNPYRNRVEPKEASFFGMIACIDENMAKLDHFLRDAGIYDNTIVVFMTDNGTATGENVFNAGMRGKKASLYDGGHRVPCLVRWPGGGISGGRDIDVLSRGTDLFPTLIELCELRTPDGLEFDGWSLVSLMLPGAATDPRFHDRTTVVQFGHTNESISFGLAGEGVASVLWNRWRLVEGEELHDLDRDPGQQVNRFEDAPEVAARLRDHYAEWWEGVKDGYDDYQRIRIGSAAENPSRLCSADWAWVYADNPANIRGGVMDSGTWHVEVAAAGRYRMTLRRWPEESGLGIAAAAPVLEGVDGTLPEGRAFPVSSAWLEAGGHAATREVPEGAPEVTFETVLEPGPAEIRSWWIDQDGKRLAGAYYLTAELQ